MHIAAPSRRLGEARTAAGEPYDGFLLRKRAGTTNELVDQIPATPERAKPKSDEAKGESK